ncbi:alpha/beta hydrolase [Gillisia sp. M10.2A]|uniref:Alpha/beta hydrolase n=1 Tax=Gillisia lutea TaxID=2909668 RepID=A0ABS9EJ16_9FLAO|nr:alpha/beta hydrolase [Gillisia lutea]MCF4101790.1 alpha/beta hydrolase [Gillisia lutea]
MFRVKDIIHVYFMPGLAANPSIFEYINLPEDQFEMHLLEWLMPEYNETLVHYSERLCENVKHDQAVLIGVSFGGVVVQEMSKFLNLKRLIIISSVKCTDELPRRMRYAAKTGLFKMIPTSLLNYVDQFEKVAVGDFLKKRAVLYRKYLSIRDEKYLDWSLKNMICWKSGNPIKDLIHIHGDKDEVFPIKYIKGSIVVKGGTHIMIINRFRWFNRYLPEIILNGKINNYKG